MDFPQGFVRAEPRGVNRQFRQVIVDHRLIVATGVGEGAVEDLDVAVDVDLDSPPVLESATVADHEAGEAWVLEHEGVADYGFDGVDVDGVLGAEDAVDYLVHVWLEEQPAGGSEGLVGVVRRRPHVRASCASGVCSEKRGIVP